jgi:mercuric ion binding protein
MLGVACTRSEPPVSTGRTVVATFAITGMATPSCPLLVKTAVGQMKGVKSVEADLESRSARVEYDEAVTNPQKILEVIKDKTGFGATLPGS